MAVGIPVVDSNDPAVYEEGAVALTSGVTQYNVLFSTLKLSTDYDFNEFDVENTEDANPLVLTGTPLERRTDGFIVEFSGLPDTGNYIFNWSVTVNNV
jgi:hypothetical protein